MFEPEILGETREGATVTLRFQVSPALAYFSGHFDGCPILPGIVQVHWAIAYARRYFGLSAEFAGIENLKFQRLVRPGVTLDLALRHEPSRRRMYFSYNGSAAKYSSGIVTFGA
jgi:3-hydroxymyristoyl/3-hydroxydecanoyl-(acyl carrier protein) dehydratase